MAKSAEPQSETRKSKWKREQINKLCRLGEEDTLRNIMKDKFKKSGTLIYYTVI